MRRRYLCSGEERIDLSKPYFAIGVLEDGLEINLLNNYEYCIDDGVWKKANSITNIQANAGQTVYFRGNLVPIYSIGIGTFTISKKCNLSGNIMSLLFEDDFEGQTDLSGYDYAFYSLFRNCTTLQSVSSGFLPATVLTEYCYAHMFEGCTSLVTAPELPATMLAYYCYYDMFIGCTSLVSTPKLPATTLAYYCYSRMFCDCTSLTSAPALPATTLAVGCYNSMFQRCSSLTTAPVLPATTLQYYCYYNMFYNCTKLNYIKALFTTTPDFLYTQSWVSGVASNGTFIKNKNATWNVTGVNGIPTGWTVQTV